MLAELRAGRCRLPILCRAYSATGRSGWKLYSHLPSFVNMSGPTDPLRQNWVSFDPERWPRRTPVWAGVDPKAHPLIAAINRIAAPAADALGPLLWAILILLFVWTQIATD